jgi:hypothetical protein
MDLIKREDAIKAVRESKPWHFNEIVPVLSAIKGIPSAEPKQEWIPCSERLPRPYTEVLVCDECGWISLGLYRPCDVTEKDSGWSTLTRIKIPTDGIIAWMPLPEPYKAESEEV